MLEKLTPLANLLSGKAECWNLSNGQWSQPEFMRMIKNPVTGTPMVQVPDPVFGEMIPFITDLKNTPVYGLHNPLLNVERYRMLGDVCAKAGRILQEPEVLEYFTRLVQTVMPKSYAQAKGEVVVTARFLENFSGDQVRFLGRGFTNPGDHRGQQSQGYRFPFGPVLIIAPFNFPIEIPVLQVVGSLLVGNRPVVKVDSKVSIVFEQFLRLLFECGLPMQDVSLMHCRGERMGQWLKTAAPHVKLCQFTGSTTTAQSVTSVMEGKVKVEDAGFDWKVLGPDYKEEYEDWVAYQADQDAYAASGQKCSAQSVLFVHRNWDRKGALLNKMQTRAEARKLDDLTVGPVLTWTTERMLSHVIELLEIPGAKLLFGGEELENHSIPQEYGAIKPTAVLIPFDQMNEHFNLITKEVFGPVQVVTVYDDVDEVIELLNRMEHHLTAAIVSNDPAFRNYVLARTVNGTTYYGIRARTTGAPQNHFFGPGGNPLGAGIGTVESIINTFTYHRELVLDEILDRDYSIPAQS